MRVYTKVVIELSAKIISLNWKFNYVKVVQAGGKVKILTFLFLGNC